jgi:NDP-sugar pyrophosphorylase family protein
MQAIIMAAGKGERLHPITEWLPKPLLPIGGRPIIETLLTNLRQAGISRAIIIYGHLGEVLRRFLGDGSRYGMELIFREQTERLGTAHAVMQAADLIMAQDQAASSYVRSGASSHVRSGVMVMASDTAFSFDHIAGLMQFHRTSGADVSLSLKRLPVERLSASSSVAVDAAGRVTQIVEKPAPGTAPSDIASAPLYIYLPSLVDYLSRVGLSVRNEYELPDVIAMMIDDGLKVMGKVEPVAPNLTSLQDLLKLNFDYLRAWL